MAEAAIAEARRCVREVGFPRVFIRPNPYGGRHFDAAQYLTATCEVLVRQ